MRSPERPPNDQSRADLFLSKELGVADLRALRRRLSSFRVLLVLDPHLSDDRLAQTALLTAANILCRLGPYCPHIVVQSPPDAKVTPGVPFLPPNAMFSAAMQEFMASAQGSAKARLRSLTDGEPNVFDVALIVGISTPQARRRLWLWYERWTGGYSDEPRATGYDGPNPFGCLIAASLGAVAASRAIFAVAVPDLLLTLPTGGSLVDLLVRRGYQRRE